MHGPKLPDDYKAIQEAETNQALGEDALVLKAANSPEYVKSFQFIEKFVCLVIMSNNTNLQKNLSIYYIVK